MTHDRLFEERLFVHLSIIFVFHCIMFIKKKLVIDYETKHLNIILLRYIIRSYRVTTDIYMHFTLVCYTAIQISLIYITSYHFHLTFWPYKSSICIKLHIFAQFGPLATFFSIFSYMYTCFKILVYQIWFNRMKKLFHFNPLHFWLKYIRYGSKRCCEYSFKITFI